jgi:hypothetical protein
MSRLVRTKWIREYMGLTVMTVFKGLSEARKVNYENKLDLPARMKKYLHYQVVSDNCWKENILREELVKYWTNKILTWTDRLDNLGETLICLLIIALGLYCLSDAEEPHEESILESSGSNPVKWILIGLVCVLAMGLQLYPDTPTDPPRIWLVTDWPSGLDRIPMRWDLPTPERRAILTPIRESGYYDFS